jgi:hypothetical protein
MAAPEEQKDPFAILGLPTTATADEVRSARRRLSKRLHPDALVSRGEQERLAAAARLADVNRAVDLALAALRTRVEPPVTGRAAPVHDTGCAGDGGGVEDSGPGSVVGDTEASFCIDALPVEAFELLVLALSAIGDPKVVDEPYLLEGVVDDPSLGLCRIELVPDAGGTIVTIEIEPMVRSRVPPPPASEVAGRLVAEVEALGRA